MVKILILILFAVIFSLVQGIVYLILGTTPADEARKQIKKIKNSRVVTRFILEKQIFPLKSTTDREL